MTELTLQDVDHDEALSSAIAELCGTTRATFLRTTALGGTAMLAGIDITVAAGEITCIVGPSGSGKSTLLRCINGLETVDSGVLRVNGEDLGFRETPSSYIALSKV